MTTRNTHLTVHPALGGLDVASDATVLDPNFLTVANNVEYREGGQRKRRPGFRVYSTNSSTNTGIAMVSTSASVRAIQDYWKYGNSLSPTQHYVAVTGASIFASTGMGSWTALTASSSFGIDTNRNTNIVLAGDYAVVSDGVSGPVAYDQTGLTSTALVRAEEIPSDLVREVSLYTSGTVTITTTDLFTFTSTAAPFLTVSSTSDLVMTTTTTHPQPHHPLPRPCPSRPPAPSS